MGQYTTEKESVFDGQNSWNIVTVGGVDDRQLLHQETDITHRQVLSDNGNTESQNSERTADLRRTMCAQPMGAVLRTQEKRYARFNLTFVLKSKSSHISPGALGLIHTSSARVTSAAVRLASVQGFPTSRASVLGAVMVLAATPPNAS